MIFSIFLLFFPLLTSWLISIFVDTSLYTNLVLPSFAPSSFVFPIVWTVLYLMMGYSSYRIYKKSETTIAQVIYFIQLFINLIWPFFFFQYQFFTFSALWLLLLIILVIGTIILFFQIDHTSGYLLLPYLFWITFALFLNITIVILN
ncbi:TspO/MBR family protein [Tannockella kyphosi]|uniref:TspO/MBR family protein n=1 Tax=Tannockella kyphosi TaxID=2899121 RepID=UPI0020111C11|nr:TspO/MBR family protein [Tannockella kyphosi]